MTTRRFQKTILAAGTIFGSGAWLSFAQTTTAPIAMPTTTPSTLPTTGPATAPTTREAAYDRLLGSDVDRPERPILPVGKPTIELTSGSSAMAPNAPELQTRREGSYIINQTGRLTKSADGSYEFSFIADAAALQDPPMKVLPNLKLGVMEDSLETASRDLIFRVTGMVTEYRGRNYILLEKVVVVPDVK